jgi:hypothetical protein
MNNAVDIDGMWWFSPAMPASADHLFERRTSKPRRDVGWRRGGKVRHQTLRRSGIDIKVQLGLNSESPSLFG